jgi:hypothetical protein
MLGRTILQVNRGGLHAGGGKSTKILLRALLFSGTIGPPKKAQPCQASTTR